MDGVSLIFLVWPIYLLQYSKSSLIKSNLRNYDRTIKILLTICASISFITILIKLLTGFHNNVLAIGSLIFFIIIDGTIIIKSEYKKQKLVVFTSRILAIIVYVLALYNIFNDMIGNSLDYSCNILMLIAPLFFLSIGNKNNEE